METKKTIKVSEATQRAGKVLPLLMLGPITPERLSVSASVLVGGVYLLHDDDDDDDEKGGGRLGGALDMKSP